MHGDMMKFKEIAKTSHNGAVEQRFLTLLASRFLAKQVIKTELMATLADTRAQEITRLEIEHKQLLVEHNNLQLKHVKACLIAMEYGKAMEPAIELFEFAKQLTGVKRKRSEV